MTLRTATRGIRRFCDRFRSSERFDPEVDGDVPWAAGHLERYRFAQRYLRPTDTVLDVACGVGYGSQLLSSSCAKAVGVDRSFRAIRRARARYHTPTFRRGRFFDTSPDLTGFDVVVSFETIEHLPEPIDVALRSLVERSTRLVIGSVPLMQRPGNPYHHHFGLDESHFACLASAGAVRFFYQDREPGYAIRSSKADPQNLIFVLDRSEPAAAGDSYGGRST